MTAAPPAAEPVERVATYPRTVVTRCAIRSRPVTMETATTATDVRGDCNMIEEGVAARSRCALRGDRLW